MKRKKTRRDGLRRRKARRGEGELEYVCVCVLCFVCVALLEGGREGEKEKAPSRGGE